MILTCCYSFISNTFHLLRLPALCPKQLMLIGFMRAILCLLYLPKHLIY